MNFIEYFNRYYNDNYNCILLQTGNRGSGLVPNPVSYEEMVSRAEKVKVWDIIVPFGIYVTQT